MAYTAKTWADGDTITAAALNNLENGAAQNASDIAEIQSALPSYIGEDIPRKSAATYTPGTADQTIASGQYLNGDQIIKGDANLTAANIKSGVSVFGVNGSYEGSGGIDTSDATATADNIEDGKTAYVNGEKITGNLPTSGDSFTWGAPYLESNAIKLRGTVNIKRIFNAETTLIASRAASDFGDATAEDVAEGKTFTSSSGVKIVGTAASGGSESGGDVDNCEAYHITSVSAVLSFQNTAGTIKVWGYGSKGSSYSTTNYAFVGDGYYSGTYGAYSKTTASFGLNADGTLSGLPSGLTTLDVLVTKGV